MVSLFVKESAYEKAIREGNNFLLAWICTYLFVSSGFSFVVAAFGGYLKEMLAFVVDAIGTSTYVGYLLLEFSIIPGMLNFSSSLRKHRLVQYGMLSWMALILLYHGVQQNSLAVYPPFSIANAPVSGWHTSIPTSLSLYSFLCLLAGHLVVAYFLGLWLINKSNIK